MLPVEFLPDVDELPVSWMNRLALANGFIDVNDMLRSYRIIDGKKVVRHLDYFPKVLGLISDNTWSKSILSIYKQDVKDQYDIIPYHNDEHLCVCPECMKEDMTRFGHIVYHFQHQYPGSFTCWKHKCILEYVQPDQRFIQDMNRMEFIPIKGSYDRDTEFKMFSTCYSKGSIFYKIVRYQLEVLMRDKHLTDNEVVEAFRCKGDEEELPMKVVQMIHTKSVDYFTFREQRVLLQLLFDDYPRYVSFFSKIDPVHMIGYRRRKVSNGMFLMTVRNEQRRRARRMGMQATLDDAVRVANHTAPNDDKTKNIRHNRKEESILVLEANSIGARLNTDDAPSLIPLKNEEPEPEALSEPESNEETGSMTFEEALQKIKQKM